MLFVQLFFLQTLMQTSCYYFLQRLTNERKVWYPAQGFMCICAYLKQSGMTELLSDWFTIRVSVNFNACLDYPNWHWVHVTGLWVLWISSGLAGWKDVSGWPLNCSPENFESVVLWIWNTANFVGLRTWRSRHLASPDSYVNVLLLIIGLVCNVQVNIQSIHLTPSARPGRRK